MSSALRHGVPWDDTDCKSLRSCLRMSRLINEHLTIRWKEERLINVIKLHTGNAGYWNHANDEQWR